MDDIGGKSTETRSELAKGMISQALERTGCTMPEGVDVLANLLVQAFEQMKADARCGDIDIVNAGARRLAERLLSIAAASRIVRVRSDDVEWDPTIMVR